MSRSGQPPGPDAAPALPQVRFDPRVDLSPYELFRRLREGRAPALYHLWSDDLPEDGATAPASTLRGACPLAAAEVTAGWTPPPELEVVLIDGDGTGARAAAVELRRRGVSGVRALFGGLRLYDYALDPRVVGEERFLEPAEGGRRPDADSSDR